jgi:hypothetical protein
VIGTARGVNVLLKLDKVIVRVLATLQLLASGLCFLAVLFALNYGGAAASPLALPLISVYSIFGIVSGLLLYSAQTYTRFLALTWHGILVGFAFVGWFFANGPVNVSDGFKPILCVSALSLLYLGTTLLNLFRKDPRYNGQS